jgi:glutamate--cysteine ligase
MKVELGGAPAQPERAVAGPLPALEAHVLARHVEVERWLREQWLATPAPFYASVDLRNAGFKLAPVDTNLFPAGFNNLSPHCAPLAVHALQAALERLCPGSCEVALIPESHTRNLHYLESVATLAQLLEQAGYATRVGSLLPDLVAAQDLALPSGRTLRLEPLERRGDALDVGGHEPCVVLLNNDLSGGRPALLEGLAQPVVPPLAAGWTQRRKSVHFEHYRAVAREFAAVAGIDPWCVDPLFLRCGKVDFMHREGEECLVRNVGTLLAQIRAKYEEHGIAREPFVIIKADAGTYGMGVMTARSVDDVRDLNRKQRTRMAASKEGLPVTEVIVQEGVYSFETVGEPPAVVEPVVYMVDRYVVGGFYRVHTARGPDENLNAPGMHFEPLAFGEACNTPDPAFGPRAGRNRLYTYGVVARLAALAAARELAAHG